MPKHGKRYKEQAAKVDRSVLHTPMAAMQLVKDIAAAKFDETIECSVRLGVDTRRTPSPRTT